VIHRLLRSLSYMCFVASSRFFSLFTAPPPTEIYTLSLHDALPILDDPNYLENHYILYRLTEIYFNKAEAIMRKNGGTATQEAVRSEEHTSELQSRENLVCRLLLEKKKK